MEQIYHRYPERHGGGHLLLSFSGFHCVAKDKTYANQKKALEILNSILIKEPNHPGIATTYHASDYPPLADLGLNAARSYARLRPFRSSRSNTGRPTYSRGLDCGRKASVQPGGGSCGQGVFGEEVYYPGKGLGSAAASDGLSNVCISPDVPGRRGGKLLSDTRQSRQHNRQRDGGVRFCRDLPARYAIERGDWRLAAKLELHPAISRGRSLCGRNPSRTSPVVSAPPRSNNAGGLGEDLQKLESIQRRWPMRKTTMPPTRWKSSVWLSPDGCSCGKKR